MLQGIYLTLMVGPVVPIPVPQVVVDALTSVEITSSDDKPSGFQLNFTLSNKSPLHTIFLIAAGQTPLLRVILMATLNGMPHVLMDGVMTRSEVAPGADSAHSMLTITGEDLTKVMDLQDFSGLPYPAMPAEARVALIIAKYAIFGLVPLVVPSLFLDLPVPVQRIPTHKGTDLNYIVHLAKDAGYVFNIEPGPVPGVNVAYWGPEIKVGVPQPALNFNMDAHTNVESLSFSFDGSKGTLPIVFIQEPLTKVPIPIPIPKINPLQPPLGLIPASLSNITLLRDTAKMSPMQALSKGVAVAAESQDAVSGRGTLDVLRYGHILKARRLVGARGVGPAFDGLYYVKSVKHKIKRGEYKQEFTLSRNGLVSTVPVVPT